MKKFEEKALKRAINDFETVICDLNAVAHTSGVNEISYVVDELERLKLYLDTIIVENEGFDK